MSFSSDDVTAKNFLQFYEKLLPYIGQVQAGFTPCGTVITYYGETAPQNYLVCDGSQYNKSDYPQLWTLLSSLTDTTPYVIDGDNTKFKIPDLRGEFLRGSGTNSHTNQGSGANVGVHQDATEVYVYYGTGSGVIGLNANQNHSNIDSVLKRNLDGMKTSGSSDSGSVYSITSRPTNTSVLYCIAYKDIYIDARFDYSLEEKVIGTWIDGKPLYQKTIQYKATILPNENVVNIGIDTIENIVYVNAVSYNNNKDNFTSNPTIVSDNGSQYIKHTFFKNNGHWCISGYSNRSDYENLNSYITFQYTKTTD